MADSIQTEHSAAGQHSVSHREGRLLSLDALRGFDMFCLLIADRIIRALAEALPETTWVQVLREQFTHPDWEGFTFYDLIFPLFEFLIGAAVFLSVSKRLRQGQSKAVILRHALVRVAIMVFLGMWVNGNLLTYDPARFQLTYSVLQMLAIAYLIAVLFVLFSNLRGQLIGFVLLLAGYWALQTFVPLPAEPWTYEDRRGNVVEAPAHQVGVYERGGLFSHWIDEQVFGSWDRWRVGWILQSMTHGCSALLGVFAARLMRSGASVWLTVLRLAVLGALCLAAGWAWDVQFPVIKRLWTSSYVLVAGGWSFLLLALFSAVVDGCGLRRIVFPFVVIGANSILAYMMSTVFRPVLYQAAEIMVGGLGRYTGDWQGVILASAAGLFGWLFLLLLYRTKTLIRI
jgi:predicted acyltransferase